MKSLSKVEKFYLLQLILNRKKLTPFSNVDKIVERSTEYPVVLKVVIKDKSYFSWVSIENAQLNDLVR